MQIPRHLLTSLPGTLHNKFSVPSMSLSRVEILLAKLSPSSYRIISLERVFAFVVPQLECALIYIMSP
jgi:hypothetical protein